MIYKAGTVTLTQGSTTVIGVDTEFLKYVNSFGIFRRVGDSSRYMVTKVISNTELRLANPYQGVTISLATYSINMNRTANISLPLLNANLPDPTNTINDALVTIDRYAGTFLDFDELRQVSYSGEDGFFIRGDFHESQLTEGRALKFLGGTGELITYDYVEDNSFFDAVISTTPTDETIDYMSPTSGEVLIEEWDVIDNTTKDSYAFVKTSSPGNDKFTISGEVIGLAWASNDVIKCYGHTMGIAEIDTDLSESSVPVTNVSGESIDLTEFKTNDILYNYNRGTSRTIISGESAILTTANSTDDWAEGDRVYTVKADIKTAQANLSSSISLVEYGAQTQIGVDSVKESHIDFGLGAEQISGANIPVSIDALDATNVSDGLTEIEAELANHLITGEAHVGNDSSFEDDGQGPYALTSVHMQDAVNEIKSRINSSAYIQGVVDDADDELSFYAYDFISYAEDFFSGEWWVRAESGSNIGEVRRLDDFNQPSGEFIFASGETFTFTMSEGDIFSTISQAGGGGSGTSVHNDLTSIQGGTTTERYHLDSGEYATIPDIVTNTADIATNASDLIDHEALVNEHIDWTDHEVSGVGEGIALGVTGTTNGQGILSAFTLDYYPEELVSGTDDIVAGLFFADYGITEYTWLCHANLSDDADYGVAFGIGLHGEGQRGILLEQSYATNDNGEGACIHMVDKFKTSDPGVLPWIDIYEGEYDQATHTWSDKENIFKIERDGQITGRSMQLIGCTGENTVLTVGNITGQKLENVGSTSGLLVTAVHEPISISSSNRTGINGFNYIRGTNYYTEANARGLLFGNATIVEDGGSGYLDATGAEIFGGEGVSVVIDPFPPFPSYFTVNNIWGIQVRSALEQVIIGGNATTALLKASLSACSGEEVMLDIEEPTLGLAGNYQVVLQGSGEGAGIWFDSAERIYSDGTNLCVAPSVVAETNISVGTDSPSAGFRGTGDIYATSGIKAMEGLYSEAVANGAGLEVSDNSLATTYTNAATPTATLTASTQTIYDPNATFTDAYIGQFVKVITSDAPSYTGATGDIVSVTDSTHIIVSFGSTGGDAITDATGMSFVIYPSPNCYVSDNGDIKFKVGASDDASFKISSPTGNNDHAVHVVANAGVDGHGAVEVEIDADNKSSVSGFGLKYDATGYVAGISGTGLNMIIDNSGATGGDLHGIDVKVTDTANTDMETVAVGTNAGVDVIHQHLGTASAIAAAFTYDLSTTTYTDVTAAFAASGSNVQMFTGDNDEILIGSATKFDQVNVILAIGSSRTINPTFEYIEDDGDWVAFTPSDDTSGFQNSGTVRFDSDNLATWGQRTVNEVTGAAGAVDYYWVKITRTRNFVATPPTESTIEVTTTGTFHTWDSTGRLGIKTFSQATEPDTTDLPANLFCFWIDTDDSKLYICYNQSGTIKTTELN